jgi:integrase
MIDNSIMSVGKFNGQLIEKLISEENLPSDPFSIFILAIRSPVTREKYLQRIGYFFDFLGIPKINDSGRIISIEQRFNTFLAKAKEDNNWLTTNIVKYLQGHRLRVESKEITGSTLRNYIKPIKLFCEQMDIEIPWKKIIRGMPRGRRYANDRAPTLEEIRKISDYPDRRIKPIVYLMASSGIRLGAFDYLKWSDIEPIMKNDTCIAAKVRVYAQDEEEYYSFTTKEAYESISEWMNYRIESGEEVTKDSWLMRNLWDVTTQVIWS